MSLIQAADLLRQYNKKKPINSDQAPNIGAWSYANPYDALYEKFRNNKNFNINAWHQSIKLGEQDTYLSLLEQNKDTQMSDRFYDPQYYNYETMMLELYKPLADDEKLKEQFHEVFDPVTQKYVKESLGKMSDRQYIQYQIDRANEIRTNEITRQIEQQRKDTMGWLEKAANYVGATAAEFGEGVISSLFSIIDFIPALGVATADAIGGKNWLDAYVDYYAKGSLTAFEKQTLRASLDEWERTHTYIRDIDGNMTPVGKYVAGIANSIGMMMPAILANAILPKSGMPVFYAGIYGSNIYENATNPATEDSPSWIKIANAAIKTGAEAVIEYGLDKMLGGTLQNQLIGLSGKGIVKEFGKHAGLRFLFKSAAQEGLEEFLQDFSTNLVDQFTGMIYEGYQHTGVNFQTLVDSFLIGALSSIFMSGGAVARNAIKSKITKGKSDVFIEDKEGNLEKVKGLNRLAWSSMMSDFQNAIETLQEKGDLDLAREVYSGITVMAQLYQSFSTDRIINAEKLLQRVANAERRQQIDLSGNIVETETEADFEARRKADIKTFADIIYKEFTDMVSGVQIRHAERIKKAIGNVSEKLKDNGVTTLKSAVNTTDGIELRKDPDIVELEEKMKSEHKKLYADYDWIFTTDGHVAIEEDKMLFVPEAWLKNYKTEDIYKFLAQEQILAEILKEKDFAPLLQELVKHNKEFTQRKKVTREAALMDFLFNPTVYQHFLLSRKGENLHKFKNFNFLIFDVIQLLGETKERKAYIAQILEKIKQTWREPILKAVINWNMNPQVIGADSILTERDKRFINQYQARKKLFTDAGKGGKISASFQRTAKTLLENGKFTKEEKALIDKGMADDATDNDRLMAVAMLREADYRYTNFDFEAVNINLKIKTANIKLTTLLNNLERLGNETDLIRLTNDIIRYIEDILYWQDPASERAQQSTGRLADLEAVVNSNTIAMAEKIATIKKMEPVLRQDLEAVKTVLRPDDDTTTSPGAFVIPPQAISSGGRLKEYEQFKADKINEFKKIYGVSARILMMTDDLSDLGLTIEQYERIQNEMSVLGVDNTVDFVIRKLEIMLGDKYVVTPVYKVEDKNTKREYDSIDALRDFEDLGLFLKEGFDGFDENVIDREVRHFTVLLYRINEWSDDKKLRTITEDIIEFADWKSDHTPTEVAAYILKRKDELLNILQPIFDKAVEDEAFDKEKRDAFNTPVVNDFEIVQKIPAEQLLKKSLLDDNLIKRNQAFIDMFETGKTLTGRDKYLPRNIKDFLGKSVKKIGDWTVRIENNDMSTRAGFTRATDKLIVVNIATSSDYLHTLTHEINHAIQYEYYLSRGFNPETASMMTDFLDHVLQNYPELIAYALRRNGNTVYADDILHNKTFVIGGKEYPVSVKMLNPEIQEIIAYLAYRLVQGEFWAEYYMHNGKLVKAYTMAQAPSGKSYIVSPDGKHKFEIPYKDIVSKQETVTDTEVDPVRVKNAMERTFDNIFGVRSAGYIGNKDLRDTYHTGFTKNKTALIQRIINKGLPIIIQSKIQINDIILNPEQYLSQEMLDKLRKERGEITEGSTYHFLKEWFENNTDGVSIDRDGVTHEYLFVNDNAFDDLLSVELAAFKTDDKGKNLVEKYTGENGLNRFYSMLQLMRLNLPSTIKVIVSPDVKTETVFDDTYPDGAIFIQTDKDMTNAEFIDTLNHEFRHVMQYYNNLEMGFTPDFKVTADMMADLKKNVPEIFKNEEIRALVKKGDPDEVIARHFVYYMIGGEQNAYSFRSAILNTKPAYVIIEAGRPTIFTPWYDAKTGEGRYQTDFLASAKTDDFKVERKPKNKGGTISDIESENPKKSYKYERNRYFSNAKARGTNLEFFVKKGKQNDMDPDLQNFIIGTTGHLDKLPKELSYAIQKGKLTKQALFKWFRRVDYKDVNDFTFNLLNKHMFKNTAIENMEQLEKLTKLDVSFYWAASIVLRQAGLDSFDIPMDVDKFVEFINTLDNGKWKNKIEKKRLDFDWYYIEGKNGKMKRVEIPVDEKTSEYMRVLAMQFFDGTLAGAFYTARTLRKVVREFQNKTGEVYLDAPINEDADASLQDIVTEHGFTEDTKSIGNDIIALYNLDFNKAPDEMIVELVNASKAVFRKRAETLAQKLNISQEKKNKLVEMRLKEALEIYAKQLYNMSNEDLQLRYEQVILAEMTGVQSNADITDTKKDLGKEVRKNIVARIKGRASRLIRYVSEGKAVWNNLPKQIRDMFETVSFVRKGKKYEVKQLKPEVYSVGRGRRKGERIDFAKDVDLTRDTTQILKNDALLKQVLSDVKEGVFLGKDMSTKLDKLAKENIKKTKKILDLTSELKDLKRKKKTEFRVSKGRRQASDTPNNFTIVSGVDMPPVLRSIFDVSFEDMADTKVQFASRDEAGNLYKKGDKGFNSALKHEINTWDAFYEITREKLLALTRVDVIDIVNFIKSGAHTQDGPSNKLAAFQIFILGYIVDGSRRNVNNWNFSDEERRMIEKTYEDIASAYGSGLNAVNQMLKVIDPMKKVRQRMLEEFNITDAELQPLFKAVDSLQAEKELTARRDKAILVEREIKKLEQLMRDRTGAKEIKAEREKIEKQIAILEERLAESRDLETAKKLRAKFDKLQTELKDLVSIRKETTKKITTQIKIVEKQIRDARLDGKSTITLEENLAKLYDELEDVADVYGEKLKRKNNEIKSVETELRKLNDEELRRDIESKLFELRTQLDNVQKRAKGRNWYKKIKSLRYLFMLSSPTTGIRNGVNNVILTGFNKIADFIGKIIFTKKGYAEGQWNITDTEISDEVKTFIDQHVKNSELFELLYDGTTKYDDRAKKVLLQKELFISMIVNALESKFAAEHKFDSDVANKAAKFVNKMISDKHFIKVAAGRYLGKMLTLEVAKGNIDLSRGLSNEVLNLFASAVIEAGMEYMHKRSFLADMIDSIRYKYPVLHEILVWWQPFINSSFNWFSETLKYGPYGIISGIYRMHTLEKQIAKLDERRAKGEMVSDSRLVEYLARRDVGKGVIGMMLIGLGVILKLTGVIKIEDDEDKFYIVAGDVKVDITSIFGSSSVLIGASLAQSGQASFDTIMTDVTENMLEGFLLKDILDRHEWNKGTWEAMLTESESILRSFVPQAVQLFIRATNNERIRYTPGFKGMWERWLNSWVPTQPMGDRKINPYTGAVETKYALPFIGEFIKSGILGPRIFWSEVSELEAFAREYGVNKREIEPVITINGEEHKFGDKEGLNIKYGELNKKSLAELQQGRHNVQMPDGSFKTLSWKQMSDIQKARVIDRTMTKNAEIAKIIVWTQLGHKYYASDSLWQTLKELGVTANVYKGDKGFVV